VEVTRSKFFGNMVGAMWANDMRPPPPKRWGEKVGNDATQPTL